MKMNNENYSKCVWDFFFVLLIIWPVAEDLQPLWVNRINKHVNDDFHCFFGILIKEEPL